MEQLSSRKKVNKKNLNINYCLYQFLLVILLIFQVVLIHHINYIHFEIEFQSYFNYSYKCIFIKLFKKLQLYHFICSSTCFIAFSLRYRSKQSTAEESTSKSNLFANQCRLSIKKVISRDP